MIPAFIKQGSVRNLETENHIKLLIRIMIISFIPGTVLDIIVKPGQIVKKGDDLMILDSMKMQNQLKCSIDGKIKNIPVKKGDKVSKGTVLLELE